MSQKSPMPNECNYHISRHLISTIWSEIIKSNSGILCRTDAICIVYSKTPSIFGLMSFRFKHKFARGICEKYTIGSTLNIPRNNLMSHCGIQNKNALTLDAGNVSVCFRLISSYLIGHLWWWRTANLFSLNAEKSTQCMRLKTDAKFWSYLYNRWKVYFMFSHF